MDTLTGMNGAIGYIEENLTGEIDYAQAAELAACSAYHFQRMFASLVGVPLSEYIRRRRLTLAAHDLQTGGAKIIDIAAKYGYASPDAFGRAFRALHGITPTAARKKGAVLKAYPRVRISLSLKGAEEMRYTIVQKPAFRVVGVRQRFSYLDGLDKSVGGMWAGMDAGTMGRIASLTETQPPRLVGMYSEMYPDNTTDYTIGIITGKPCPKALVAQQVPEATWAVFSITGPLPGAMAEVWGRIFSEWFPATGYEHAQLPEIEWYTPGNMQAKDYECEIWIPVVGK